MLWCICFYSCLCCCDSAFCMWINSLYYFRYKTRTIIFWLFLNYMIVKYFAPGGQFSDLIDITGLFPSLLSGDFFLYRWLSYTGEFIFYYSKFHYFWTGLLAALGFIKSSNHPYAKLKNSLFIIFWNILFMYTFLDRDSWTNNLCTLIVPACLLLWAAIYFGLNANSSWQVSNNSFFLTFWWLFDIFWLIFITSLSSFRNSYDSLSDELLALAFYVLWICFDNIISFFLSIVILWIFGWWCIVIVNQLEENSYAKASRGKGKKEVVNFVLRELEGIWGLILIHIGMLASYYILSYFYHCPFLVSEGFIMLSCAVLSYSLGFGSEEDGRNYFGGFMRDISQNQVNDFITIYLEVFLFRTLINFMT
ncbi:unnamed protein product [Blepharisma stoltei]|uniref:Uncharacterized protein n=1 Tax=Blepharisma stoltei TaxID=1481888 RepID=A0AAU9J858_9CILI|nr:unnamed protein product [Blepharisma stoltei]